MSAYLACSPAPEPLEAFAVYLDAFVPDAGPAVGLSNVSVRAAAAARPLPYTLMALVGAEPLVQAQAAEVQRLQFFLSEATWDAEAITHQSVI